MTKDKKLRLQPLLRGPIARRLFIFNVLIVFMPVAGFFSLSTYEDRLLADLEDSLVQQGRIIAAWLQDSQDGESDQTVQADQEAPNLTTDRARQTIVALRKKHTARIRIVDAEGNLLADSATDEATGETGTGSDGYGSADETSKTSRVAISMRKNAETTFLYQALSFPVRVARKYLSRPTAPLESADYYSGKERFDGGEIARALSGSYGAITRISSGGQNSVTLYSAIPIMRNDRAVGAVLVSQSTYRILASLYEFRLETGKIFVLSLAAAALISLILGITISRPLSKLRKESEEVISERGSLLKNHVFHLTGRKDEIDLLSASLTSLVESLGKQIALSENFASDAAHELRNSIAGIRNSAELIPGATPAEASSSVSLILENAAKMDGIVASLRELSRIEADSSIARTETPERVAQAVMEAVAARHREIAFSMDCGNADAFAPVPVSPEHLEIVVGNLLENAASFSPPGGRVSLALARGKTGITVTVRDQGPGIPEAHLDRVFDRFFSWRPDGESSADERAKAPHAGIGLSIVEAIMRKAGGTATCANHSEGGAVFTLTFPAALY